jgi:hypothetical protein
MALTRLVERFRKRAHLSDRSPGGAALTGEESAHARPTLASRAVEAPSVASAASALA